jgi:hypothetical protein
LVTANSYVRRDTPGELVSLSRVRRRSAPYGRKA